MNMDIFWCVSLLTSLGVLAVANEPTATCILTALPGNSALGDRERKAIDEMSGQPLQLVNTDSEFEFSAVVEFIAIAFPPPQHQYLLTGPHQVPRNATHCSKILGVVGDLGARTAKVIHTLASRSNLRLMLVAAVAPSTSIPVSNLALSNLLDMRPLSHYIEALVSFLDHLNWTRVGLLTDNTHYYQYAAQLLEERIMLDPKNTVIPSVRITDNVILRAFKDYETRIIVVLMDWETRCSILREAQKLHFNWPEYSLIVLDLEASSRTRACEETYYELAVITLTESSSDAEHSTSPSSGGSSFNIISASISALLYAVGSNYSFLGEENPVDIRDNKRLTNISFAQVFNGHRQEVARYHSESQHLVLFPNTSLTSDVVPRGSTLVVEYVPSVAHNTFVMLSIVSCSTLVSVVFILYVCFHKEPEIKATSVAVSLCMFLGCYLLLLFLPVLLIDAQPVSRLPYPEEFICNLLAWLSLLGLPLTIILATLFVKMLRVYLIFCTPHSYKRKLFSNPFLFAYIALLTFPSFIFLLLWSSTDTFTNTLLEVHERSRLVQFERCLSNNTIIWLSLQLAYITTLIVALVILAFKSSKIRFENFKDTKETNAFAFVTIFVTIVGLMYFYFFYSGEINFFNTVRS
jgi:hypothetical protein